MPIVGFPNQIQVTLGPNWTGLSGLPGTTDPPLSEDDVLVLTEVPDQFCWSEDGTLTPSSTNRIVFRPQGTGSAVGGSLWDWWLYGRISVGDSGSLHSFVFSYGVTIFSVSNSGYSYNFLDIFNGLFDSIRTSYAAAGQEAVTYGYGWNPGIFKSMEEYVEGGEEAISGSAAMAMSASGNLTGIGALAGSAAIALAMSGALTDAAGEAVSLTHGTFRRIGQSVSLTHGTFRRA